MILELCFPVYGDALLAADHTLLLHEALTRVVPRFRTSHDVEVLPVSGRKVGDRFLILMPFE